MRGAIGTLLVADGEATLFEHPAIATPIKGTGDLLAALLIGRRIGGADWRKAAESALASVFEIVAGSARAGADELMLAELQHALVQPHAHVNVRRMRSSPAAV
jgi:pyridoxine kinase